MSEWKTYKLGELGTLARGKSKHRPRDASFLYGGEYPFIQTGDIKAANHRINKHTQTYSEEGLKQSKLWPAGTICITIAANIADTAILSYPACFPDSVIGFVADEEKCNVDFIEYLLQYTKRSIQSHSIGSVQDNINLGTFENFTMEVPDLPTQRAIASILSSLDDKIELNLQMNQTLEALAQAIFKEWFVNFNFPGFDGELVDGLPKGWKREKIGNIFNVTDYVANGSFASLKENVTLLDYEDYAIYVRTTDNNSNFSKDLKYVDEKSFNFLKKSRLYGNEIIISNVGDVGTVFRPPVWLNKSMTLGSNAIMITDSVLNNYICQFLLSSEGQHAISGLISGSAQPKFNKTAFRNLEVTIPSDSMIGKFNSIYDSLRNKINANKENINCLTQIRDSLLPKLMTGKIEIQA